MREDPLLAARNAFERAIRAAGVHMLADNTGQPDMTHFGSVPTMCMGYEFPLVLANEVAAAIQNKLIGMPPATRCCYHLFETPDDADRWNVHIWFTTN